MNSGSEGGWDLWLVLTEEYEGWWEIDSGRRALLAGAFCWTSVCGE
jgi:hypothetical protein